LTDRMLTISQLAAYAGVTVRAVRHYHAKGLIAEPERDHSGYRRYDAAAVVELIKIRTLAEAGVPLGRVSELLHADPEQFAAAVEDIDRRLRAEIRDRQRHRRRIALLVAGDSLALPPDVVAYLDLLRKRGATEEMIAPERDAWILMAARWPDLIPAMMADKISQLEDRRVVRLYGLFGKIASEWDAASDDVQAHLEEAADLLHTLLQAADSTGRLDSTQPSDASYTDLMDSFADNAHPAVARLRELLYERGWTGWTRVERRAL
jgi:DNA-binding transcriptional MerR regulator